MNYTKVVFICLAFIALPNMVIGQYCNDTACASDEEYVPNVTKHLWLNKISTTRHFTKDTSLRTLIAFHPRFKLKKSYKFLNSIECLNCIVSSKRNCVLDTNKIKTPHLKWIWLTPRKCKGFPLFILTALDLKGLHIAIKDERKLHYLDKYLLEDLSVYFDNYLKDSLPSFIYYQKDLKSLHFKIVGKVIYLNDSILNLKKLESLGLPIDLDEKNLAILSKMNLKQLVVNSVKLSDVTDIQKKLPQLIKLKLKQPITLEERVTLRERNPNIEIDARIDRNKKAPINRG